MEEDYSDIIQLKHPEPKGHQRMSMQARAAQFAPFAALTGHSAAIAETARYTEEELIPERDRLAQLDIKLKRLLSIQDKKATICVTFFLPDTRKNGGSYQQVTDNFLRLDINTHSLVMTSGLSIDIRHITDIQLPEDL